MTGSVVWWQWALTKNSRGPLPPLFLLSELPKHGQGEVQLSLYSSTIYSLNIMTWFLVLFGCGVGSVVFFFLLLFFIGRPCQFWNGSIIINSENGALAMHKVMCSGNNHYEHGRWVFSNKQTNRKKQPWSWSVLKCCHIWKAFAV